MIKNGRRTPFRIKSSDWELLAMALPMIAFYLIFCYWPMYGIQIAFRDYIPTLGFLGSKWVGLKHFIILLGTPDIAKIIANTVRISLVSLLFFPVPILLSLMINLVTKDRFKKFTQTCFFLPYFVSVIVVVGMLKLFGGLDGGLFNQILSLFGAESINFFGIPQWFVPLYVLSDLWQRTGFNTIIYTGALTSISPDIYESASIEGANRLQKIRYIELPALIPTIVTMFILSVGNFMSVGFEKAFLMKNSLNSGVSEIISTYVYQMGIENMQYSFSAAVGLLNSVINMVLLVCANYLSLKMTSESLW